MAWNGWVRGVFHVFLTFSLSFFSALVFHSFLVVSSGIVLDNLWGVVSVIK